MMKKIGLGLALALAAPVYAEGLNTSAVKADLEAAIAGDSRIVWMIYGPFALEKMDAAIALLEPVKDRVRVGLADADLPARWIMLEDKLTAAGFTICKQWGEELRFVSAQKPDGLDGDYTNSVMWGALTASNTDVVAFIPRDRSFEAVAGDWEMGGVEQGVAKSFHVFGDFLHEEHDPRRVTEDEKVGAVASLPFADGQAGGECLTNG